MFKQTKPVVYLPQQGKYNKAEEEFWTIWGETVLGWPTELERVVSADVDVCGGVGACGVHVPVRHGEHGARGCVSKAVGLFGPIVRANTAGLAQRCNAGEGTLHLDRQVAALAIGENVSVRFLTVGKHYTDKFFKCSEMTVEKFGAGYCYLHLFQPSVRLRVARVLGPLPLMTDVVRMFLAVGPRDVGDVCYELVDGAIHLELGASGGRRLVEVVKMRALKAFVVMANLIRWLGTGVRIGGSAQSVDKGQDHVGVVGGVGDRAAGDQDAVGFVVTAKVHCDVCGFMVNPVNHEERCRVRVVSDREPRTELLGDALHALDVKCVVAAVSVPDGMLTVVANAYISAPSQRSYLESVEPGALGVGRSHHSWGSAFERRYELEFRRAYLDWLVADLLESFSLRRHDSPAALVDDVERCGSVSKLINNWK